MYGEIIDTIITGLRSTQVAKSKKIPVVMTSDDEEGTVNTTLPAIAVTVMNSDNAQVYIGGLIEDRIEIQLAVLMDLTNYSWSKDKSVQSNIITLGSEIRNAFEHLKNSDNFVKMRELYNFNPMYRGFKTYKRVAMRENFKKEVTVFELKYTTSVVDKGSKFNYFGEEPVSKVEIKDGSDARGKRVTTIPHQTKKRKRA